MDVEADDVKKAEELAGKTFGEIEKLNIKVENARFVDKNSGYFVRN